MIYLAIVFAGIAVASVAVAVWSLQWPRVKGTIEVSIFDREWEVEASGPDATAERKGRFYLAYSYSVDGVAFQGSRIAPLVKLDWQLSGAPELSAARSNAHWYREGAVVDVAYCPMWPAWACLEPGGFLVALLLSAVAIIAFFVA